MKIYMALLARKKEARAIKFIQLPSPQIQLDLIDDSNNNFYSSLLRKRDKGRSWNENLSLVPAFLS